MLLATLLSSLRAPCSYKLTHGRLQCSCSVTHRPDAQATAQVQCVAVEPGPIFTPSDVGIPVPHTGVCCVQCVMLLSSCYHAWPSAEVCVFCACGLRV